MLEPLPEPVYVIVANMPYVREAEASAGALGFEPRLALDGGRGGLEKIYTLCKGIGSRLRPDGCLLLEVGRGQAKPVSSSLRRLFPLAQVEIASDLGGIARVVSLKLTQKTARC